MGQLLNLSYYGDPILRKKVSPVEKITDEIRILVDNMNVTMFEKKGVGLAAPQVGVSLAIFISNIDYEDDEGVVHFGETKVYINPKLSNPSSVLVEREEGCLSIPGLYAPVLRPLTIEIEAMDLEGNIFKKECSRYLARCIMHEHDHLEGILFIDRIKGKKRTLLEPELKKIKQQYYENDSF
jgi:peptide deformylase